MRRLKRTKKDGVRKVVFSQRISPTTANIFYDFGHEGHHMADVMERAAILLKKHGMKGK